MTTDVVVVGAGVVGLACAAEGASRGRTVVVVERHVSFGQETSSRNSEVVHSGIYYPRNSLKTRLCLEGNRELYEYCDREGVWTRRCGKIVVAVTPEEVPKLEAIHANGVGNGVEGLRMLDGREVKELEPNVSCVAGLLVPSTGLVDSHEMMKSLLTRARTGGADVAWGVSLVGTEKITGGYRLKLREHSGEETIIECGAVVNAAGNSSDDIATLFGIDVDAAGYRLHPNRGHYFRVSGAKGKMVSRLVYPVPPPKFASIGIHVTLDRAGQVKLGPDAEYLDPSVPESEWYRFDEGRLDRFFEAVVRYLPGLRRDDLTPDQVGVRPKLQAPGEEPRDFVIAEESARSLPGLVNLVGIESPGLTSSLAIARMVFGELLTNQ